MPLPRLALLALLAVGCCNVHMAAGFLAPTSPSTSRSRAVVMLARRQYEKKVTRGDFLLKSALATGALVPVVTGLRRDKGAEASNNGVLPAADASPFRRGAHDDDDDGRGDEESVAAATFGPPLRFDKARGAAMQDMREVIDRFGGSVRREGADLIRVDFGGSQELELRFTQDGSVHTRVGRECWDMRRVNLLGEGLAAKGGWAVKGYPLCIDPATAKYI